ncbi:4605_t:CDS:2, partial [Acaulospora colombiana]
KTNDELRRQILFILCQALNTEFLPDVSQNVYIEGKLYPKDELTNVTPNILSKTTRRLHLQPRHPISILRTLIEAHFNEFQHFNSFSPVVTAAQNFDDLGFPEDHPGRGATDSYYVNKSIMLRTHTSAHQLQAFRSGAEKFLISADVYRRDEIDSCHYPIFHQMEGAQIFNMSNVAEETLRDIDKTAFQPTESISTDDDTVIGSNNPIQPCHPIEAANAATMHLKHTLNVMVRRLFKEEKDLKVRWIDAYFPFTSPSWEMEILYKGKWLEICGCGVVKQELLDKAGRPDKIGWAFGLGLERISMILFDIPDIRLFWSQDSRFMDQFKPGEITKFQAFSKYPSCTKDISFWINDEREQGFHDNDFCEVVRDVAGDLAELVELIDDFTHPKTKKRSLCYRINYRSMDK